MQVIVGIYKITCKNNNKFYIGSSINIERRLKTHIGLLKHNKHDNPYLQKCWNQYGKKNFKFEIIEIVSDIKQLPTREKWWLDCTKCYNRKIGFNISTNPLAPNIGIFIDLIGQRFGKLVVIKYCGTSKWLCLCDCGNEKIINSKNFKNGKIKSCGCLRREQTILRSTKHGHCVDGKISKIYTVWKHIIERKKDIGVCKRWLKFENFYKDVGNPPKGLILNKINNNRNYSSKNWRWSTPKERANNRKNSILITFNNKTQILQKWAIKYNINPNRLWRRLYQLNWSIEKALITPIKKYKRRLK